MDTEQAVDVGHRLMQEDIEIAEEWNGEDIAIAEGAARRILIDTLDNMDGEMIVGTLEETTGISAEWIRTAIAATHQECPEYLPWAGTVLGTPRGTPQGTPRHSNPAGRPGHTATSVKFATEIPSPQQRQLDERTRTMAAFIAETLATEDEKTEFFAVAKAACGL
eukprot:COSAG02_NODE_8471_length_2561_cov_4.772949_2_plen_165_part_00